MRNWKNIVNKGRISVLLQLIILHFSFLIITGCTEPMELDLEEQELDRLVVEGWVDTEAASPEILLSYTGTLEDGQTAPPVTGAQVEMLRGNDQFQFGENAPGRYVTPFRINPQTGDELTLRVLLDGEAFEATTVIPPVATLDTVTLDLQPGQNPGDWPFYEVRVWFTEPDRTGDAYTWKTYLNGTPTFESLQDLQVYNDDLVNGNYIPGVPVAWCVAEPGDTITVVQYSLTPDAYDFFEAILSETEWKNGIFDPAPANVPSNLSNGALGYFMGSSTYSYSVVVP